MKTFKNNNFNNTFLDISDKEYKIFLNKNHYKYNKIIEDNLLHSYIMIDSKGYLLQNTLDNYIEIGSVIEKDFYKLLTQLKFNKKLYKKRYKK